MMPAALWPDMAFCAAHTRGQTRSTLATMPGLRSRPPHCHAPGVLSWISPPHSDAASENGDRLRFYTIIIGEITIKCYQFLAHFHLLKVFNTSFFEEVMRHSSGDR